MRIDQTSLVALAMLGLVSLPLPALGQSVIVPDETLGAERSQVDTVGSVERITGGARRSQNLFHSFEAFNVSAGRSALFASPEGVENIFSRVTGGNPSEILGTLGVEGTVNLFFLNPNGIMFGENASLDIEGSFTGSTGTGFEFADGSEFSAVTPGTPGLLTVTVPLGLQYGPSLAGAAITNRGAIAAGQNLMLLADRLDLQGQLSAGRDLTLLAETDVILDGAVASGGYNRLTGIGSISIRGTSVLLNEAVLSTNSDSIGGAGNIGIRASTLLARSSELLADTSGQGDAGDIIIQTTGSALFNNSDIFARINAGAIGDGGDIQITAGHLRLLNDSDVVGNTRGRGNASNIAITASAFEARDRSNLAARSLKNGNAGNVILNISGPAVFADDSDVLSAVEEGAEGNGGNIQITATTLAFLNDSEVSVDTDERGDSGSIILRASESILLDNSNIDSRVNRSNAVGEGGNIRITTVQFRMLNNANIFASTEGNGNAGSIIINTKTFEALNRSNLEARTQGTGNGGRIVINATERVTFSGVSSDTSPAGSMLTPEERGLFTESAAITQVDNGAVGTAGDIQITTSILEVIDGAALSSSTFGEGDAGNIIINASDRVVVARTSSDGSTRSTIASLVAIDGTGSGGSIDITSNSLVIDDGAIISAESNDEGTAGNILLNVADTLQLRDSNITTAAISSTGGDILINTRPSSRNSITLLQRDADVTTNSFGNGGNIIIDGAGIVAFGDSDIISRSEGARGGNITLSTFLREPARPANALDFDNNGQVDLNASGALASGIITTPDTSFLQNSLAALPEAILNTESLIANSCVVHNKNGSSTFIITGDEGLPEQPGTGISSYATGDIQPIPSRGPEPSTPLLEPQGVYRLPNGELILSHACQ